MKERIILWLMEGWTPKDPERFIRRLIKQYKLDKHLHENPVRKAKRSTGDAVM